MLHLLADSWFDELATRHGFKVAIAVGVAGILWLLNRKRAYEHSKSKAGTLLKPSERLFNSSAEFDEQEMRREQEG